MTRRWFSLLSLLAMTALVLPLLTAPATAQTLDELRASGKVGERFDGFAVARDPAAADLVKEVNDKRRAIYEKEAAKQKISVAAVGAVYAGQIITQVPAGTWFLDADGEWRQK
jgi:hypothetical protein